jgi:Helix-turn-helix domain
VRALVALYVWRIQMTDEILTTAEIAAELRCSKAQVYRLLNGDVRDVPKLPSISLGRKKVVRRATLEEWKRGNEKLRAALLTFPLKTHEVGRLQFKTSLSPFSPLRRSTPFRRAQNMNEM